MTLAQYWFDRLTRESPQHSDTIITSIIEWLLEDNDVVAYGDRIIEYRWRILRQSYLGKPRSKAYSNLMMRLIRIVFSCREVQSELSSTREQQLIAIAVLDKILRDVLESDRYIQDKMLAIANCTSDKHLRNSLLFASLEEYCLQPLQNQILLIYLFNSYLQQIEPNRPLHNSYPYPQEKSFS